MDLPLAETPFLPDASPDLSRVPPPPFVIDRPDPQKAPVIFVSAHSGRDYPPDLIAGARLDARALRRSEDSFVDELFAAAPSFGAPLLRATFARAYCDANREAWELDPTMFDGPLPDWVNTSSARVVAGLGTIARIVSNGEAIYRGKLRFADAELRIRTLWQPFHDALATLIAETRLRFGVCVVVDCHSMPASSLTPRGIANVVLGDAHGTACDPGLIRTAEQTLIQLGYRPRRNEPYAGGFITRHYGRPREQVHALQIELARDLYMDEAAFRHAAGFDRVRQDMSRLIGQLVLSIPRPR
jgi:N-formylglutamate deformylase